MRWNSDSAAAIRLICVLVDRVEGLEGHPWRGWSLYFHSVSSPIAIVRVSGRGRSVLGRHWPAFVGLLGTSRTHCRLLNRMHSYQHVAQLQRINQQSCNLLYAFKTFLTFILML